VRFGKVYQIAVPGSWQAKVIEQFCAERGEVAPAARKPRRHGAWRRTRIFDVDDESDACRCSKCGLIVRYRRGGRNGGLILEESTDGERWAWCTGASPGRPSPCKGRKS
jgi:hypothetical protein